MSRKVKYGDIVQFKPTSWTGRIVAKIDGSEYCHSALILGEKWGQIFILESNHNTKGVRINVLQPWGNYLILRPKKIMRRKPVSKLMETVGKRYDYNRIWHAFLARFFGNIIQNNDSQEFICSELVDYAYNYKLGGGRLCTPATIDKLYKQKILFKVK